MHDAIQTMLESYSTETMDQTINALREILQQLALLGLWRAKFFEHAAFYGGSALRMLHGLPRYSEDLDFSLLHSRSDFTLGSFGESLRREIASFGFEVDFQSHGRPAGATIESAFLKANTLQQVILINPRGMLSRIHPDQLLRIKLEVDTDPPKGFEVENRYLLQPIPFSVRAYQPPDLFAGKIHALLCRRWKTRVKGRDWYDMVWYVAQSTPVRLGHLEARMRQSGDYQDAGPLLASHLLSLLEDAVTRLDVDLAREEVSRFVTDPRALGVWSTDFFLDLIKRIEVA